LETHKKNRAQNKKTTFLEFLMLRNYADKHNKNSKCAIFIIISSAAQYSTNCLNELVALICYLYAILFSFVAPLFGNNWLSC